MKTDSKSSQENADTSEISDNSGSMASLTKSNTGSQSKIKSITKSMDGRGKSNSVSRISKTKSSVPKQTSLETVSQQSTLYNCSFKIASKEQHTASKVFRQI